MTEKPKTGDGAVTVAELMARYGVEQSGQGRAHRRRAREGGIPVAELTGEIPVIRPSEPPVEAIEETTPETPESADDAAAERETVADDAVEVEGDVAVEDEPEVDEDDVDEAAAESADEPIAEADDEADEVDTDPEDEAVDDAVDDELDEVESEDDEIDAEADVDVDAEIDVDGVTDSGEDADAEAEAVADEETETVSDDDPAPTRQFAAAAHDADDEDVGPEGADTSEDPSPWAPSGRRTGAPIAVIPPIAQEFAAGDDRTLTWADETVADEEIFVAEFDEAEVDAVAPAERGSLLSTLGQWLALGAQTLIGVVVGAAVFLGFIRLWDVLPYVALVLAVLVILALAAVVRILRKSDDSVSILLAVVVGVIVTIGPLVFVLSSA